MSPPRNSSSFFPMWIAVLRIRIRDPVPFRLLDQESGMGKKSGSGSGMNNPDHISQSLEIIFFGLKYLNSLMRIWDPGSGMEKFGSGIRCGKKSDPG
jgi:hypothetical protein